MSVGAGFALLEPPMRPLYLLALVALSGCANARPVYEQVHGATLRLETPLGTCSGTAVARDVALTASHCFGEDKPKTIRANGELCEVRSLVHDGNDHVLVTLGGCPFKQTAKLGKPGKVGDRVFLWSNPHIFRDLLVFGTVAGTHPGELVKAETTLYDLAGYYGSSGGAIFNERGEISAVVSIGTAPYRLMGSFPIVFTRKQLEAAGL
jgi:hypothetical protein